MLNVTKAKQLKGKAYDILSDAQTLNENANSLEGVAQGTTATSDEALKQKAGNDDRTPGTLRYLAKELYDAANALSGAVSSGDDSAASSLATEVGASEGTVGKLREKLKELAAASGELTTPATEVRNAYDTVSGAFKAVQEQNNPPHNKYKDHQNEYQAVVSAWEAFNKVYNADLKKLAKDLKNAVGETTSSGLQQALSNLNTIGTTQNAEDVIKKFNEVAGKYKAVKALESTYQAIIDTKSHYDNVLSKFTDLQRATKLKAEATNLSGKAQSLSTKAGELYTALSGQTVAQAKVTALKNAASKPSPENEKGLKQLLVELNNLRGSALVAKAKEVTIKFEGFSPDSVQSTYNAVKNNDKAKQQVSQFGAVKSAFKALQTEYNKGKWKNISLRSTV
ncbi:uncharacterized protein TA21385 [Theileria annulata]|uniref:Uncharacterized protein n=1 Tax=Theileria annulata TaxID=5874 RepID=Q4UGN0_THEAN|nr:uncharacterized protein TA21385 [Theileria annulata]CAI73759.1 hypothetical protein TA21385 [Theileria annulata]|eukprot:XP_954436.1 hypothetical protein TA21385 [Theileria annulata]